MICPFPQRADVSTSLLGATQRADAGLVPLLCPIKSTDFHAEQSIWLSKSESSLHTDYNCLTLLSKGPSSHNLSCSPYLTSPPMLVSVPFLSCSSSSPIPGFLHTLSSAVLTTGHLRPGFWKDITWVPACSRPSCPPNLGPLVPKPSFSHAPVLFSSCAYSVVFRTIGLAFCVQATLSQGHQSASC